MHGLLYGQLHFSVKGTTVDKNTNDILSGVNISVENTQLGTTSDLDGYFTITLPTGEHVLNFTYVGYKTFSYRITLNKDRILSIELEPEVLQSETISIIAEKEKIIRVPAEAISAVSISPRLIEKLPNFGEVDILRAFQLLPGISGSHENSAGLYVRGGTPDQNLILFDGMTLYHIDHFYGFFSAFNANSVDDVILHKGGFPAQFGGRTSSVMEIKGKPADMERMNFGLGVSLLSANTFLEIPIIKNKLSWQFSYRRSYTDILKTDLYNSINEMYNGKSDDSTNGGGGGSSRGSGKGKVSSEEFEPAFFFYDLNSKLSFQVNRENLFTLSLYNGMDNLDNSRDDLRGNNALKINDVLQWGNIGISAGWQRAWSAGLNSKLSLSYSNYFSTKDNRSKVEKTDTTGQTISKNLAEIYEDNNVRDMSLRLQNEWKSSKNNILKFGTEITQNDISYLFTHNDTTTLVDKHETGLTYAFYLDNTYTLWHKLKLNTGLRSTYYSVTKKTYWQPRLSAIYSMLYNIRLKAAYGIYHQYLSRVVREDVLAGTRDFWLLANDNDVPVSDAKHYIAGIEWEPEGFLFAAEFFRKDMQGLSEYSLRFSNSRGGSESERFFHQGDGIAQGVELLAQKKLGQTTGWIAYTYAQVAHTYPDLNKGLTFFANHDQTHEAKVVLNHKFGKWDLSATWIYATGTPYTAPEGIYNLSTLDGKEIEYIHVSDKNAYRLPAYHRLDLAGNYNFKIAKMDANLSISLFNLYNRTNIWYKQYDKDPFEGTLTETNILRLGFTPNFSFRINLR